ncbi:PD-(D/E)XK nuclease family protein [Endozoicomonas acroporae]|uniref:PDDEXK-like family protein n=1 Tax=Endozoicomonas acroporae TaxID=1701104 RepID=UPI003D7B7AD9
MDLDTLKTLLRKIQALPRAELPEATLFSIGGKGYYENPTTDVLAFFCDSNGAHGLGDLVINALFKALPELPELHDFTVISKPEREVKTARGKRIDLLLEGNDWVMVIENKIYHQQNNPFGVYESYVREHDVFKTMQPLFVVLSPDGTAPHGWQGLSYPSLLKSLKEELAQSFIEQPLNKWLMLLREFILHLEGIMAKPAVPADTIEFVLDHLDEIKQANDLKYKAIDAFQKEVQQHIQNCFDGRKVSYKLNHWWGYPALRFYFDDWNTASDVVLFLNGAPNTSYYINYYACDIETDQQRNLADEHLAEPDCDEPWDERSRTIRGFKVELKTKHRAEMVELLVHKMKLLDRFETEVRSQWNVA